MDRTRIGLARQRLTVPRSIIEIEVVPAAMHRGGGRGGGCCCSLSSRPLRSRSTCTTSMRRIRPALGGPCRPNPILRSGHIKRTEPRRRSGGSGSDRLHDEGPLLPPAPSELDSSRPNTLTSSPTSSYRSITKRGTSSTTMAHSRRPGRLRTNSSSTRARTSRSPSSASSRQPTTRAK
jgi:hypothetical protein